MIFAYNKMLVSHSFNLRIYFFLFLMLLIPSCQMPNQDKNDEGKIKIACVGDSITYGMGIKNRDENAYPAQLSKILGEKYEVKNFGVSGRTLLKTGDFPYWVESAYMKAIRYNPDIVVIELGTNDSKFHNWTHKGQFVRDYTEMINSFKNLPARPEVYICFPSPLYFAGKDINDTVITRQVIPKIDSVGKDLSIPVIDLYRPLSNQPQHFPDGIHPNAHGAKIIARTVAQFIAGS